MTAPHLIHTFKLSLAATAVVIASSFASPLFAQEVTPETSPQVISAPAPTATPVPETPSTTVTLTAIPPRYGEDGILKIKPGEKQQFQVRVRNASDKPMMIRSEAKDFILGEDGQTPIQVTEDVSNRWSLSQWMTLVPATQTLEAGETGAVNVLIDVPAEGLPGGHYAMITHQPDTTTGVSGTGAAVSQQVGTLLYAIIDGPINESSFIRDFNVPNFSEYGPIPFNFTVDNQSDVHIRPALTLEIFNALGKKVATIEPEGKNIFPLTSRSFETQWDTVWGSGYYTAKLTMSYGTQGEVVVSKTHFWLLPIKLVIAIGVSILAVIAALISIRRHMLHHKDDKNLRIQMLEERLRQAENKKLDKYEE